MGEQLAALRAASIFEGLAQSLGAHVNDGALALALSSGICDFRFGALFREQLQPAFESLSQSSDRRADGAEAEALVGAVRRVGSGIQGFAQACYRCHLVLANELSEFAQSLFALNSSSVRIRPQAEGEAGAPSILVGKADVGEALLRAGRAAVHERWRHVGASLAASMLLSLGDGEDHSVLHEGEDWVAIGANGIIKEEADHARWARQKRMLRLQRVHDAEHVPWVHNEIVDEPPDRTCCCCWSEPPPGSKGQREGEGAPVDPMPIDGVHRVASVGSF